ncbi:hypothetical protein GCM10007242_05890 [Pigmentiphaga litoralis]|nr:hypothetical protein GCM10007242_05890 [Pigmentiphaga litoralis]
MLEQQIDIGPELALGASNFCGLGSQFGVVMDFQQRKVPEHVTDIVGAALEQLVDCAMCCPAVRTFKVTVFDDHDGRGRGTDNVIDGLVRYECGAVWHVEPP